MYICVNVLADGISGGVTTWTWSCVYTGTTWPRWEHNRAASRRSARARRCAPRCRGSMRSSTTASGRCASCLPYFRIHELMPPSHASVRFQLHTPSAPDGRSYLHPLRCASCSRCLRPPRQRCPPRPPASVLIGCSRWWRTRTSCSGWAACAQAICITSSTRRGTHTRLWPTMGVQPTVLRVCSPRYTWRCNLRYMGIQPTVVWQSAPRVHSGAAAARRGGAAAGGGQLGRLRPLPSRSA